MSKCKCTMAQSLVGDGCRICQPDTYMDMLETHLKEADERIAVLEDVLRDIGDHCYDADAQRRALDALEGGGDER